MNYFSLTQVRVFLGSSKQTVMREYQVNVNQTTSTYFKEECNKDLNPKNNKVT